MEVPESSANAIYLLVEYDEGSREDITIIGSYSTFDQAVAVGKSLLKNQHDEWMKAIESQLGVSTGKNGGSEDEEEESSSEDEDEDALQYFVCSCQFNAPKPKAVNYFEHEIKLEN